MGPSSMAIDTALQSFTSHVKIENILIAQLLLGDILPYTLDFLREAGLKPAMGYLLPRIVARSNITYGEVADRLRQDLNIDGKVFPTHIGSVAGPLQDLIHQIDPLAPLLNVLIVRADSEEASDGVDGYLKRKYNIPSREDLDPDEKSELLRRAAKEVYAFRHWAQIYQQAFDETPPSSDPAIDIEGSERDGQSRGGPAESEEHKKLKAYVLAHPEVVGAKGRLVEKRDEYCLLSGDEVDVFLAKNDQFWLVEVKSERSNERDMMRGCYQCIKYRAVFKAQLHRTLPTARVHAILVTKKPLSAGAKVIAAENNIRHVLLSEE
jgi:hypothetical protein